MSRTTKDVDETTHSDTQVLGKNKIRTKRNSSFERFTGVDEESLNPVFPLEASGVSVQGTSETTR